jgi:myo-inositol-1(or 4)-monophosphatase
MNPMLNMAVRAARRAGTVVLRSLDQIPYLKIEEKGQHDFVSEIDRQSEIAIIETLRKAYPQHSILAEETGAQQGNEFEWIIDPLDGTTNYLHQYPQFSISIALRHQGLLVEAVVYDPLRDELFSASRGGGCYLNGRRVRVSSQPALKDALLGTGFPFKMPQHLDTYLDLFKALFVQVSDVRRAGSAALDLAYVAAGRLDGFWEIGLKTWDMAGGALLIQEAGGLVSDFSGGHDFLTTGNIVAGSPKVFKGILQTIQPHLSQSLKR